MALKLSILDQVPIAENSDPAAALANTLELARCADGWGYHRYWIAEHHLPAALASPAPEVLLARLGAETRHLRLGSGGIMLPHYSPYKVAEVFSMLAALYPGRMDLGIGRAPGGGALEMFALRRERTDAPMADDFPEQLLELLGFLDRDLPAEHPFRRLRLLESTLTGADIWLLGSSLWSSVAAGQLGLPYAFAHFFSGESTRAAIERYYERFTPSRHHSKPQAMVAVGVICADTQEQAERLALSVRLLRRRLRSGMAGPVAAPDDAAIELGEEATASLSTGREWPVLFVGTPQQVHAELTQMAHKLRLDEIIVVTITHDPAARLRSYALLAQAFGLLRARA